MDLGDTLNDENIKKLESEYQPIKILKESITGGLIRVLSIEQSAVSFSGVNYEKIILNCNVIFPEKHATKRFKLEFIMNNETRDENGVLRKPGGIFLLRKFVIAIGFSKKNSDGSFDVADKFKLDDLKDIQFFSDIVTRQQSNSQYYRYYAQEIRSFSKAEKVEKRNDHASSIINDDSDKFYSNRIEDK